MSTNKIGVSEANAIRPKPSVIALRPLSELARPTPSAVTSGTVTVGRRDPTGVIGDADNFSGSDSCCKHNQDITADYHHRERPVRENTKHTNEQRNADRESDDEAQT